MKIVGLDSKRKPADPCPYCAATPACVDFTCPRLKRVWSDQGAWEVTFHEKWKPDPPPTDEPEPPVE